MQKGLYPNEYKDDWEKLSETSLSEKEDFYSHQNMEDITVTDCRPAKRVGEYHDLYLQSDRLLLGTVFESFWNMFFEIYKLDPTRYFLLHQN